MGEANNRITTSFAAVESTELETIKLRDRVTRFSKSKVSIATYRVNRSYEIVSNI